MKVLIEHGTTPTGVGVAQNDLGQIMLLTPCCGVGFRTWDNHCRKCMTSWQALSVGTTKNLAYIGCKDSSKHILEDWLQCSLGVESVQVEWSE